jgi:hypothetical protein
MPRCYQIIRLLITDNISSILYLQKMITRIHHNDNLVKNRGFISLNSVNQLIFVMVRCGVLFEVRTEFLNII